MQFAWPRQNTNIVSSLSLILLLASLLFWIWLAQYFYLNGYLRYFNIDTRIAPRLEPSDNVLWMCVIILLLGLLVSVQVALLVKRIVWFPLWFMLFLAGYLGLVYGVGFCSASLKRDFPTIENGKYFILFQDDTWMVLKTKDEFEQGLPGFTAQKIPAVTEVEMKRVIQN